MRAPFLTIVSLAALAAAPAIARPGGWANDRYDSPYPRSSWDRQNRQGPAEGKVVVSRFIADGVDAASLIKSSVTVAGAAEGINADARELSTFQAAVIDQLAASGYQTATTAESAAQIAEVRVTHDTVVPEEGPRKPVSGEMEVGVSNRGSSLGLALNIDLSKPLKALISTRLEARIKDKASGKVLWEGRADIVTREGSDKWNDTAIATRLAKALFDDFPGRSGETRTASR